MTLFQWIPFIAIILALGILEPGGTRPTRAQSKIELQPGIQPALATQSNNQMKPGKYKGPFKFEARTIGVVNASEGGQSTKGDLNSLLDISGTVEITVTGPQTGIVTSINVDSSNVYVIKDLSITSKTINCTVMGYINPEPEFTYIPPLVPVGKPNSVSNYDASTGSFSVHLTVTVSSILDKYSESSGSQACSEGFEQNVRSALDGFFSDLSNMDNTMLFSTNVAAGSWLGGALKISKCEGKLTSKDAWSERTCSGSWAAYPISDTSKGKGWKQ